jgi:signal transduction histidine kinase
MDLINILIIIVTLANLFLGIVVFLKNRRNLIDKAFILIIISVFLWAVGMILYRSSEQELVVYWCRILYVNATFTASTFLFFSSIFPENKIKYNKSFLVVGVLINFLIVYFTGFTSYIINDIKYISSGENIIIFGKLYFVYVLYILSYFSIGFSLLFKKINKSVGFERRQLIYVFLAYAITGNLAFVTNLILPWFQYVQLNWLGQVLTIIHVFFTAYSIIKYRLFDLRLVISKSILYFFLIGFVATAFTSITFFTAEVFNASSTNSRLIITLAVSLIIVIGLDPLKRFLSNATDKVFYRGKIDYQNVLRKLGGIIAKEINLGKLLIDLSENIEKLLKYKKVDFLYKSNSSGIYRGIIDKDEIITDKEEIVKYLEDSREIIITEELEIKARDKGREEKKYLISIVKRLRVMNIGLIAPVISENRIIAFLTINKKLSEDVFSTPDLNLISVIVPQIANALEKAKLYNEVQEFNVKLQEKVNKATEELKYANVDLETRNKYLTALQKVSSTISRSLDLTEVVQFIANSVRTEIGFVGGIVNFVDDQNENIYIGAMTKDTIIDKAIKILPQDPFKYKVSLQSKDNLAVKSIINGSIEKSSRVYDLLVPAVAPKIIDTIQKVLNIKSAISVPIYAENKIIGSIDFFTKKQVDEIKDIDIEVMKSLADQTGLVIGNLRLYEQIKEKNVALKQANAHLKKLDEAKSEFLSIASHQLRTPLTGIKGYLSMILEGDYGKVEKKQEKIIQDVFNASDRMSRLINVFLNVSRIESGRLKLDYADINLGDLINECIKDLESTAREKGLKLTFKYKKNEVPSVNADSDKMKDVILNLIDNAIKYTHKGKVNITLSKTDDYYILVQIKDTGIGLSKTEISKLFSKFSRGKGISKINTGGSGLGLYIVKRIIEEHGGKAWVESEGVDKGSTFQFTLPINK